MKIAMYVFNDCRTDARVLREARSLAAAGHEVTIVARLDDPTLTPRRETRDGFSIVRVPVPTMPYAAYGFLRYPWRARHAAAGLFRAGRRRGIRGLGRIGAAAGVLLAAGLWSLVRLPFVAVFDLIRRARGRGPTPGGDLLDWLARFQLRILPWGRAAAAIVPDADVHHGHDLSGLPAALEAARPRGAAIVYDSHEVFLESGSNAVRPRWVRARYARVERAWIREVRAMITVNDELADELRRRYDPPPITVIHNCPPRWTPPAVPEDRIRSATGIEPDEPIALYHGAFSPHRGLEQTALAVLEPGLERVHAVFLGYGSQTGLLHALAADPRFGGRVHVLPAVPPDELVSWVAGADVGVCAPEASTLNHRLATPNKLWEALAAGLPVVVSDFPAMRRVVLGDPNGPLGVTTTPTPAGIAAGIRQILDQPAEDRAALRARCLAAAHDRWNWETEAAGLLALYDRLAAGKPAATGPSTSG